MDQPPAPTLSHYRLIEKIGEGGMGVVWKAEDTILGRTVAIKILPAAVAGDEKRRAMFLEEARAASIASHAHVVQVHEFGHERGLDFIVMEYVAGKPLSKILVGRPLPPDKVAQLGVPIARALQATHRKGLLHRDLKPSNVLVTADGDVKVVDFGLAALFASSRDGDATETRTATGDSSSGGPHAGTLAYMSPEQARGEPLDARSDVFSLGVVLYEMATGQRPFEGRTPQETLRAVIAASPAPVHDIVPSVPLDLERIILKALARKPGERYQTMDDFAVDLRRLDHDLESGSAPSYEALRGAAAGPVAAPPSEPAVRAPRGKIGWIAGAIAGVVVLGAIVTILLGGGGPKVDPKTVLVLPFEVHGAAKDAYLGQALAEAIAVNFAQAPTLRVLPVAAPPPPTDAIAAARAAGAGRVVSGSVSRDDAGLHLTLKLLDAKDARLIGGIVRDEARPDMTVFAASLAAELRAKLGVAARRAYEYPLYLTGDPTMVASPDAQAVLAAFSKEDIVASIEPSRRLAEAFPGELGALALRTMCLDQYRFKERDKFDPAAFDATLDAMKRLDPDNPYTPLYRALRSKGDHIDDDRAALLAIAQRPDLTPGMRAWVLRAYAVKGFLRYHFTYWLDTLASPPGASAETLKDDTDANRRAVELDPANPWSHVGLSWAYHMAGDQERAMQQVQMALSLQPLITTPKSTLLAYAYAAGSWDHVREVLESDRSGPNPDRNDGMLAVALWHLGKKKEAAEASARADASPAANEYTWLALARYELLAGNRTRAKRQVERALAGGVPADRIAIEPDMAALTASSR